MAHYESGFDTSFVDHNPDGSSEYGIFQLNSAWWCNNGVTPTQNLCHMNCNGKASPGVHRSPIWPHVIHRKICLLFLVLFVCFEIESVSRLAQAQRFSYLCFLNARIKGMYCHIWQECLLNLNVLLRQKNNRKERNYLGCYRMLPESLTSPY